MLQLEKGYEITIIFEWLVFLPNKVCNNLNQLSQQIQQKSYTNKMFLQQKMNCK